MKSELRCKLLIMMQQQVCTDGSGDKEEWEQEFFGICKEHGFNSYYFTGGYIKAGSVILSPETDEEAYIVREDGMLEGVMYIEDRPLNVMTIPEFMKLYDYGRGDYSIIVVDSLERATNFVKYFECKADGKAKEIGGC